MWSMDKILRLEEENRLRKVDSDIKAAKQRNQQQAINTMTFIVCEQVRLSTLELLYGSLK